MLTWLLHVTGVDNSAGPWYAFWSGIGGILERLIELAVIGTLVYRHHNCSVRHCMRIARKDVKGTTFRTCHVHTTKEAHDELRRYQETDWPEQHSFLNGE